MQNILTKQILNYVKYLTEECGCIFKRENKKLESSCYNHKLKESREKEPC